MSDKTEARSDARVAGKKKKAEKKIKGIKRRWGNKLQGFSRSSLEQKNAIVSF